MKKPLALFLALLFCLAAILSSCDKTPEETGGTDDPTTQYLEVIAAGGASPFTVVYSAITPAGLAADFQTKLNEVYSGTIGISADTVEGLSGTDTYRSDAYEILIGPTNRAESAAALQKIGKKEYIIAAIGNKLVVTGHNSFATEKAVDAFVETYLSSGKKDRALRIWYEKTKTGIAGIEGAPLTEGADLRIMTLNINCSDNDAKNRYEPIRNVVADYHPDIMCFQECNKAQYRNVISQLTDKYGVATTYHSDGRTYVYTPILYLKSKYEVVEAGADWLRDRYTGTNTKSIAYAVLKSRDTGKIFGVINLHGAYCSSTYAGYEDKTKAELNAIANEWREGNVRQIIEVQTELEGKYGKIPILHTADYNFNSTSTPYRMMTDFGLTEAEVSATGSRVTGIKTTHTVGAKAVAGKSIDHIFYNADRITALTHHIGNDTDNDLHASDHLPVWADIKFN